MKTKFYIKIGKTPKGPRFAITKKPNNEPITNGSTYHRIYYPTVCVGLTLDIPDKEFETARAMLEAKISTTTPAIEVKQIDEKEVKNG